MFTDEKNLFYLQQDTSTLFFTVAVELEKIKQWF